MPSQRMPFLQSLGNPAPCPLNPSYPPSPPPPSPAAVCLDPEGPKAHYRRLQALHRAGMLQVRLIRLCSSLPGAVVLCPSLLGGSRLTSL